MSDHEGHGHKAVVYKSHFLPLRHSVVTETPTDTLANKPHLTKDQALCSICPTTEWNTIFGEEYHHRNEVPISTQINNLVLLINFFNLSPLKCLPPFSDRLIQQQKVAAIAL